LVIHAKDADECKFKIIEFLKQNASRYNLEATLAVRVKVKEQAQAKADCLYGIAQLLAEARISDGTR